jgi:hypothetical protein
MGDDWDSDQGGGRCEESVYGGGGPLISTDIDNILGQHREEGGGFSEDDDGDNGEDDSDHDDEESLLAEQEMMSVFMSDDNRFGTSSSYFAPGPQRQQAYLQCSRSVFERPLPELPVEGEAAARSAWSPFPVIPSPPPI